MTARVSTSHRDRQWFIVGRWQEYEGEGRANLLRIVAVGAFYVIWLIKYFGLTNPSDRAQDFHTMATWIVVAWAVLGLAVLFCLRRRIFPASLKFCSTGADIALLTALAAVDLKADSPLVYAYFLVIALAALRFSLRLIWCSTLASMAAYVALVAMTDDTWFDADHKVPLIRQLITLLSLALTGIILGQIIRRVKTMADNYAGRLQSAEAQSD